MKIKVSYRQQEGLVFLRYVEYKNLEMAKRFFILSIEESIKALSKVNLVFEYEELNKAKELTRKDRCGAYKRMILFMKHCPDFKITKLPYFKSGNYKELYQSEYIDNYIVVNLETNKTRHQGSMLFHIELKSK